MSKKIFAGVFALALAVTAYGVTNAAYTHTVTLKVGSKGAQVMALQEALNMTSCKVGSGLATGNFGQLTKAAVMCFQTMHPETGAADGIVGPKTGLAIGHIIGVGNNGGNDNGGGNTGGTLSGTDGTIDSISQLSQYSNEEVGEGENDVKVAGFEVEASNDGDIALKSVKLTFNDYQGSGSTRITDYIDGVKVWMGSTEVGSADAADFNKDSSGVYSKTISLNSSAIVRADKKVKFYVSVDGNSNFDTTDIASSPFDWHLDVVNVRFVDGSGVVSTETSTNTTNVGVNFVSFSAAADTELKISLDSSSPDAGIVVVDENDTTDDVVLLKGKLKLEGTSDVTIDQFPVTLTSTGTGDADLITGNLTLKLDGEDFSETVSTSSAAATVTFDNLDFDMSAGDTVNFTVMADIEDIGSGSGNGAAFDQGDTLKATVTSTNRDYMDVENEEGDQLSDSTEKSGTATGDAQEFRSNGVLVELVGTPTTSVTTGTSANDDLGTFTIKFKVTAIGDDVYMSSLADAVVNSTTTTGKTSVQFDRAGTATNGGTSVTIVNKGTGADSTTLNAAGLWLISEGNSQTFEVTGTGQLPAIGAAGQFRMSLIGASWDTDSTDPTPDNAYTSNLSEFKTSYVGLN